jgi:ribonuclease HIII
MGLKRAKTTNEYELLRVQDGEVGIIVYKSGKLVHNDTPSTRAILDAILEREREYDFLLGSDEVGKGEWYGPLIVVCAALIPTDIVKFRKIGVKDSKLLEKKELRRLASEIRSTRVLYRDVTLMPEIYNARYAEFQREGKSLNDLLAWGHATAIRSTLAFLPTARTARTRIVIDKFDFKKTDLRLESAKVKDENVEIIQSSKGDTELPISVASIIAKDLFETKVDSLNTDFNIDLRKSSPGDIDPDILPKVSKVHFSNVRKEVEI